MTEEDKPTVWMEAWRDFQKEMKEGIIIFSVGFIIILALYLISLL